MTVASPALPFAAAVGAQPRETHLTREETVRELGGKFRLLHLLIVTWPLLLVAGVGSQSRAFGLHTRQVNETRRKQQVSALDNSSNNNIFGCLYGYVRGMEKKGATSIDLRLFQVRLLMK